MRAGVESAIRALDQKTRGKVEDARELLVLLHDAIFPEALEIFPELRGYMARTALVYTAMKFAKVEPDAVRLGLMALGDKSKEVRYHACMLLAVSGNRDALPALEALADHPVEDTRKSARCARIAIETGNMSRFLDPEGRGNITMSIGGLIKP